MAKTKSDLIIKKGKHLTTCYNKHTGEFTLEWDWDALGHEIRAATLAYESKQELKAEKASKKAAVKKSPATSKKSKATT